MGNHWLTAAANDEFQKVEAEERWHQLPEDEPFGGVVYAAQAPLYSAGIEELLDDSTPDAYLVRMNMAQAPFVTVEEILEVFERTGNMAQALAETTQSRANEVITTPFRMWSNSYDCIIASSLEEAKQIMRDYCGPMDEEAMEGDGWYEVPLESFFSMEVEDVGGTDIHTQTVRQWCEEFGPCYFGSTDW